MRPKTLRNLFYSGRGEFTGGEKARRELANLEGQGRRFVSELVCVGVRRYGSVVGGGVHFCWGGFVFFQLKPDAPFPMKESPQKNTEQAIMGGKFCVWVGVGCGSGKLLFVLYHIFLCLGSG